jgi:hypothetical protein
MDNKAMYIVMGCGCSCGNTGKFPVPDKGIKAVGYLFVWPNRSVQTIFITGFQDQAA